MKKEISIGYSKPDVSSMEKSDVTVVNAADFPHAMQSFSGIGERMYGSGERQRIRDMEKEIQRDRMKLAALIEEGKQLGRVDIRNAAISRAGDIVDFREDTAFQRQKEIYKEKKRLSGEQKFRRDQLRQVKDFNKFLGKRRNHSKTAKSSKKSSYEEQQEQPIPIPPAESSPSKPPVPTIRELAKVRLTTNPGQNIALIQERLRQVRQESKDRKISRVQAVDMQKALHTLLSQELKKIKKKR